MVERILTHHFSEETLTGLEYLQSYLNWFATDNAGKVWYDMGEVENSKGEHRLYGAASSDFAKPL